MSIRIEVSAGELLDRITILRLKVQHQPDRQKRAILERELSTLMRVRHEQVPASPELQALFDELAEVNCQLWQAEDALRRQEKQESFGPEFVAIARSIARLNDRRIALKRQITERVSREDWVEGKIYQT